MSKKKRLIGLLYIAVLCSQGLCAQTRQMGIEELFRLADEQSKSIQTYRTGKEAAMCPFPPATGATANYGTEISVTP